MTLDAMAVTHPRAALVYRLVVVEKRSQYEAATAAGFSRSNLQYHLAEAQRIIAGIAKPPPRFKTQKEVNRALARVDRMLVAHGRCGRCELLMPADGSPCICLPKNAGEIVAARAGEGHVEPEPLEWG